jgi:hypothetical protein
MTPALTIRQPWASLIADGSKTIETRPGPAFPQPGVRKLPGLTIARGERFIVHSGATRPASSGRCPCGRWMDWVDDCWHCTRCGDEFFPTSDVYPHPDAIWPPLPLGAIVAAAVLLDCVPIVEWSDHRLGPGHPQHLTRAIARSPKSSELALFTDDGTSTWLDGQLPLGDFAPGRWAWLLGDVRRVEDQCPECEGVGNVQRDGWAPLCGSCDGRGACAPIPATGKQGIWQVTW